MRRVLGSILLAVICIRMVAAQEAAPPASVEELQHRIEGILERTHTPAVGVALVNRDGPYWVAGLGTADRSTDRKADADTLFRIGSISKMFAAFAVLKLADEGRLSLDDKVRDRAPDVAFENPWEATHPVRIAHLLEHTTGWDDIHLAEYAYDAPDTTTLREALAYHPHSRVSRWMPGTRSAYCNAGAAVAAYIVEKVTGQRYEDYIAANFFAPLGMTSTSYFRTPAYDERGAALYVGPQAQEYWSIIYRPAGSINSSANDMAQMVHFLLLRGATPQLRILPAPAIDRMEVSRTTLGAAAGLTGGYGLANYASGYKDYNIAFHGHNGGVMGGLSELAYSSERGEGYVFMINTGNGAAAAQISDAIRGYLLRDVQSPGPQPESLPLPAQFRDLAGYYIPINPRQQMMRFLSELVSVQKITSDEKFLHRRPLLATWTSSDRAGSPLALIDAWHGLPAIAVVEDPLAGPAIQINSDLFRRVPAWQVFMRFGTVALMVLMTLAGTVALIVWGYRRTMKKTDDARLWLRLWPLIASALLVVLLVTFVVAGGAPQLLGTLSPASIILLLLSLSYPAAVLLGAIQLLTVRGRAQKNLSYWFATVFVIVHVLIAGYLTAFGVVGIRTWA